MDNLVQKATKIAAKAHADQLRRDGKTPYIIHPWEVAKRVGDDDPVAQAAAWLHDTLEDSREIAEPLFVEKKIPEEVVKVVKLLTKEDETDYFEFVKGTLVNPKARKVKIADIMANLADDPSPKQIRKYAKALLILVPEEQSATA